MSTVFLSYSSEQTDAATRIELSLKEDGHAVFRDRTALPPGEGFDSQIRAAIERSDLFVFLISRRSVSAGHYTLSELKFAERKWGTPAGHVLPVLVEDVPRDTIPPFLRAVTTLDPEGNLTAEVVAEIARMSASWWRRMLKPKRLVPAALAALVLAGAGGWLAFSAYSERSAAAAQAAALVKQARLFADAQNYAGAWETLERASAAAPASAEVSGAQELLAMDWLDNARGSQLPGGLKAIAEKVSPVLSRGAVAGKGERAADLLAHMGWADFFRLRGEVFGLDPVQSYRRAIEIDPNNVYAHTMWGHYILWNRGSFAEANRHFAIAVQSGRKREYVRRMQLAAFMNVRPEGETEAVRVANDIRSRNETLPAGDPERPLPWQLWNVYYDALVRGNDRPAFLAALAPADHLSTFRWLYPVELVKAPRVDEYRYYLYLWMLAQLQEHAGDRGGALASYRLLQDEYASRKYRDAQSLRIAEDVGAAIKRLSN